MTDQNDSSSKNNAMPKWLRQRGRQVNRMAGLKDAGVFDKLRYWQWIRPIGEHYFKTPSRVKELLPIKGRRFTAVVCFNGEVIVLENSVTSSPRTEWSGRVAPPAPFEENRPAELRHAAYDSLHGVLFFTVSFTGVYYAKMGEMEADCRANKTTRLTPVIGQSSPDEKFHGLAADAENGILYVCNNDRVTAWLTAKLDQPKKLQEITFSTPVTPTISPYKIAVHLDIRGSSKTLLAVADKEQSTVSQLRVKYVRNSLGLGSTSALSYEFVSTLAIKGSKLGYVSKPQGVHFDPAGNLLVADDKNQRIEIFPFAVDGSTALDPADGELVVLSDVFAMLKTVAVGTAANDRPLVLAGMCGPFGSFGAKRIMRLTYASDD